MLIILYFLPATTPTNQLGTLISGQHHLSTKRPQPHTDLIQCGSMLVYLVPEPPKTGEAINLIKGLVIMKKGIFVTLCASLLISTNLYANEKELHLCRYVHIYQVATGSGVDTDGGNLEVTIDGDNLRLHGDNKDASGTFDLKITKQSGREITAKNESMLFILKPLTGDFMLNTGIGKFGFNVNQGGHKGRQMRYAGSCERVRSF